MGHSILGWQFYLQHCRGPIKLSLAYKLSAKKSAVGELGSSMFCSFYLEDLRILTLLFNLEEFALYYVLDRRIDLVGSRVEFDYHPVLWPSTLPFLGRCDFSRLGTLLLLCLNILSTSLSFSDTPWILSIITYVFAVCMMFQSFCNLTSFFLNLLFLQVCIFK